MIRRIHNKFQSFKACGALGELSQAGLFWIGILSLSLLCLNKASGVEKGDTESSEALDPASTTIIAIPDFDIVSTIGEDPLKQLDVEISEAVDKNADVKSGKTAEDINAISSIDTPLLKIESQSGPLLFNTAISDLPELADFTTSISDALDAVEAENRKGMQVEKLERLKQQLFGPIIYFKLDSLLCPLTFTGQQIMELNCKVKANDGLITDELFEEYVWYYKSAAEDLVPVNSIPEGGLYISTVPNAR